MSIQKSAIIALHAQTSIHAGANDGDGVVDLPIQRESHTAYPCIFGSSMKGALRAFAEVNMNDDKTKKLFGPKSSMSSNAGEMGELLISDARLLLLPIRSLTGQFRWVTCPAIIERLCRDIERFFPSQSKIDIKLEVNEGEVLTFQKSDEKLQKLFLEEYAFTVKKIEKDDMLNLLKSFLNDRHHLTEQLAIVDNDSFSYLCRYATPVNSRNVLNTDTKTSDNLWYEETLPSETIMYLGLVGKNDISLITKLLEEKKYLQVGGNETVGMGWCSVKTIDIKEV
ncbi:type III-B CRISPR module RAMP protein Cmr4 [Phocoenobacter skyensis]|uniref:CRISPR-associated protein Cmr4 n=1 Tax=Phocoenobacter skyensis TaxID=97481 RepID=A0A1H7WUD3_9PAST|nr:type III-B CRISPR module RAMP protein Cmr4 [Pasteurella skyensis]MDP8079321.1 type III-B CRISPR module RAMP protein Cmr4 [Pasteurella skyensis]MDP8085458.1 type III-B CRISPR module RAMP protein Cmr4 [Pasteurella skyensis]MDP8170528.1 type III-B CRISPR module RAMP protein Cmr4 [Pasteurella skyensis]MDP8174510.1 type III-B CRISPR module RAMP protein Cmr4 [Pasteurella skyensis]MDP8185187.1 type III-B CRISPR module RAMP protein Cmr4 [Pasteurella skyensis]